MNKKDFMAPNKSEPTATTSTDFCPPKFYGSPSRPGEIEENRKASEKKPSVDNRPNAGAGRGFVNPPHVEPDNAFQHQTANIVTNSGTTDIGKTDLKLEFQPNILDSYDAVTYHFKLFITDPETSNTGQVFNTDKQIIIAESGVTELTIDKVEIKSYATPTVETGTGIATHVKFEILEPGGASLIDRMFYQSVALGIGNWSVMPIYLQLQFRGRDPTTSAPTNGQPDSLSSLKWLWALKLTRIKTHVTHVGTRYEFETIVYNEFALTNAIASLAQNITLDSLSTFGDAMKKLETKLNIDQFQKTFSNYSIPDSFRIIVDEKISGLAVTPANDNTNSIMANTFDGPLKSATFTAGTGIDKIVDSLLAHTSRYQIKTTNAKTPGTDGVPMNEEPTQIKHLWRIITETRPIKFDPRRQDMAREFTYYIVDYDIGILDQNVFQTSNPPITVEAQKKRLMTYVEKEILKKKYEYIFTGLNDQIINFDIVINNAFAQSQARLNGVYLNPAMHQKGIVNHSHVEEEIKVSEAINKAISLQNSAKATDMARTEGAVEDAKRAIDSAKLPEEIKNRYSTILEKSKPDSILSFIREIQETGGLSNSGTLESTRLEAKRLSTPVTEQITKKQFNFISDVKSQSKESQETFAEYMKYARSKMRPIARMESIQDRQIGLGLEPNSNSGLQKLSSMFSVALHSGIDSSLTRLKMTIKGDPFWLSPQPYEKDSDRIFNSLKSPKEAVSWIKAAHKRVRDSINILGTDNFFIVRFRTPQIYEGSALENNENTNKDVETLSGVYKAVTIYSKFESGKFTQDIEAFIDPEIRILDISEQIEEAVKKQDVAGTASDIVNREPSIPEAAKKTDRIMGGILDSTGKVVADTTSAIDNTIRKEISQLSSNIPRDIENIIPGGPTLFG